jgi:hypothetical protein
VNMRYSRITAAISSKIGHQWILSNCPARWPEPVVGERQRQGELAEQYVCRFEADSGSYEYTTDSFSLYQQCVTGSVWALDVNAVGGVQAIEPAN